MKPRKPPRKSQPKPRLDDGQEHDLTKELDELIRAGNEMARIVANSNSIGPVARITALADWQMARDAFKN